MNEGSGFLPSLDDLLLPEEFEPNFADFSNSEDVLFGPPSLILFEGQPSGENRYQDSAAPLQFPEDASTSGDVPTSTPSDQGAPPLRQRSGSSAKAASKIERKAEQNRRAYQRYRERQRHQREEDRRTIDDLEGRLHGLELERSELVQRVELLQKINSMKPDATSFAPSQPLGDALEMTLSLDVARHFAEAITLLRRQEDNPVDPATLAAVDVQTVMRINEECTQSVTMLLVTGEDPNSADGQRLVKVMKALEQVGLIMWGTQPALTTEMNRLFRIQYPFINDAEFFPPILRAMNLSAAQKLSLRDWRKRAMLESAQALQRRAGLLQRLSCQMVGDDARSMERVTMALKALKDLHDNLTAERRLLLEMHHVWHAIITPHQLVRAELAAWPHGTYPIRMIKFMETEAIDGASTMA